jgi:hypothetical protein
MNITSNGSCSSVGGGRQRKNEQATRRLRRTNKEKKTYREKQNAKTLVIKKKNTTKKAQLKPGCRARGNALTKCFMDGERIHHKGSCPTYWEGKFDSTEGGLIYKGKLYKTLSAFAASHYEAERKDRGKNANGWAECEVFRNGEWVSTMNLKPRM